MKVKLMIRENLIIDTKYTLPKNGAYCLAVILLNIFSTSPFKLYPNNMHQFICKHVIQLECKTAQILIRWLHQKPAFLDLQCFQI